MSGIKKIVLKQAAKEDVKTLILNALSKSHSDFTLLSAF